MRYIVFLVLIGFTGFIIPQVSSTSENLFYGTATFERLPTTISPNSTTQFEIKFQYTEGAYSLSNVTTIADITPYGAASFVHFDAEPFHVDQNSIARIPITITVDDNIEYEKIFLTISYVGTGLHDVSFKSSWSDSIIFDISPKEKLPPFCTSDRTACFDQDGYKCDPTGWECENPIDIFSKVIISPLKQIKAGIALVDIKCSDEKYPAIRYDRMRVACVSEKTQNELWSRGWATMRLSMPGDDISHALCNNYEGKWHQEYNGCRNISDLQCSLIGGKFVDDLKICENGICPDRGYEICVTENEN